MCRIDEPHLAITAAYRTEMMKALTTLRRAVMPSVTTTAPISPDGLFGECSYTAAQPTGSGCDAHQENESGQYPLKRRGRGFNHPPFLPQR
jgi:hypothetical protein